jgi:phage I-like protein
MSVFHEHGKMILISTPRGEVGRFFEMFCEARDGLIDHAAAIHAPAWELNPALDTSEWHEQKRQLLGEDGYQQEHAASFVSGAGQFFDLRQVEFVDGPARPEDGRE